MSGPEQRMFAIDSILKALGIEDKDDLDELVSRFYNPGQENSETANPAIHPNDTVKVVRKFVLDRQQGGGGTEVVKQSDSSNREKKDRQRMKEKAFWKRLEQCVSDKKFRVWGALEAALHKYTGVLEERSHLIDETISLQQQNNDMKTLLKRYLSSPDNQQFFVPPSQTIRLAGATSTAPGGSRGPFTPTSPATAGTHTATAPSAFHAGPPADTPLVADPSPSPDQMMGSPLPPDEAFVAAAPTSEGGTVAVGGATTASPVPPEGGVSAEEAAAGRAASEAAVVETA